MEPSKIILIQKTWKKLKENLKKNVKTNQERPGKTSRKSFVFRFFQVLFSFFSDVFRLVLRFFLSCFMVFFDFSMVLLVFIGFPFVFGWFPWSRFFLWFSFSLFFSMLSLVFKCFCFFHAPSVFFFFFWTQGFWCPGFFQDLRFFQVSGFSKIVARVFFRLISSCLVFLELNLRLAQTSQP